MSSGSARNIAVIDIGKTNAKLVLFDLARGREVASLKTENHVLSGPPYRHFDVDHLWRFIVDGLKKLAKDHHVDAISITTHASAAALLDANGTRVLPILDYEDDALDAVAEDYAKARPDFSETGSPRLPGGLNLGAQMFWQQRAFPGRLRQSALNLALSAILGLSPVWRCRCRGNFSGLPHRHVEPHCR